MAFFECAKAFNTPTPVIDYSLKKVYSDSTVGSTTSYKIEEDGIYLIILGGPYDGVLTMTLPENRAYIDGLINPGGNTRFKTQYAIGKFYSDDEIILGINQQAYWDTGYDKYIIKIDGFMPSGSAPVVTSAVNSDNAIYTIPDNELYLLVCLAFNAKNQTSTSIVLSDSSYIFEEPVITDHYGFATSDLIGCVTNGKDLMFTVTGALSSEGNSAGYGIIISIPMKKL